MTHPYLPDFYECLQERYKRLDLSPKQRAVIDPMMQSGTLEDAIYSRHSQLDVETRALLLTAQIDKWNDIGMGSHDILRMVSPELRAAIIQMGYAVKVSQFNEEIGFHKPNGSAWEVGLTLLRR
ncbi:MAG: hypothetical protein Q7J54_01425 [Candidatus Woesearchaeota archaeon]|nr:hypothetical protein [Candidatus Woesearchaeota archaeon]